MHLETVYKDQVIELKVSKRPPAWYISARPAANLLVCTEEGKILVMHEYKTATKRWIWGFPGGMIEDGETAAQASKRECEEEIGLRIARTKKICTVRTDFPDTSVTYFLGFGVQKGERKGWEKIGKVKEIELNKLVDLAASGVMEDPRMATAVFRLQYLVQNGKIALHS